MSRKKALSKDELDHIADHVSDVSSLSDFSSGSSDLWEPTSAKDSEGDNVSSCSSNIVDSQQVEELEELIESESNEEETAYVDESGGSKNQPIIWSDVPPNFVPSKSIPVLRKCSLSSNFEKTMSPCDIFHKIFPRSIFMYITQCTNDRLTILQNLKGNKKRRIQNTDVGEIQIVIGSVLIMSYNRLPSLIHYWSKHPSMGNQTIKAAISRDRFKLVSSKLYFAPPEKPANCSKTYYIDDIVQCLKNTFQKSRQDSNFQSIDESMTKFKGRSSLKQYMPLKPTKRGIKMWLRCDSETGYTYDFNIYAGKEEGNQDGTLGERVVNALAATITESDVALSFDRFFTSVDLLLSINYAAVGTCIASRKNIPKLPGKLKKGESVFKCSEKGVIFTKWQDTKDVLALSNCHTNNIVPLTKKNKDGTRSPIECPEMIAFYREHMGGVDRADQMAGLYEFDRKSKKWWIKVFYRLLMMSAVNAWVIYKEISGNKKIPFLEFLVPLAEEIIYEGKKNTALVRGPPTGRISKKRRSQGNVSMHLPVEGETRRRCARCAENKIQKRTKTICRECDIPLCKNCFATYHI